MVGEDISVELSALSGYAKRARGLAQDVRAVATGQLAGHRSIPPTLLGDLGEETGVHAALAARISELHDHLHELADSMGSLGEAAARARRDYETDEQDAAASFHRLQGWGAPGP